jgi:hypothetical protein
MHSQLTPAREPSGGSREEDRNFGLKTQSQTNTVGSKYWNTLRVLLFCGQPAQSKGNVMQRMDQRTISIEPLAKCV